MRYVRWPLSWSTLETRPHRWELLLSCESCLCPHACILWSWNTLSLLKACLVLWVLPVSTCMHPVVLKHALAVESFPCHVSLAGVDIHCILWSRNTLSLLRASLVMWVLLISTFMHPVILKHAVAVLSRQKLYLWQLPPIIENSLDTLSMSSSCRSVSNCPTAMNVH